MTGAFHGQEIPSKSKQTGGGPTLARHLRFRKGRRFIYRNFRRGTWRNHACFRVRELHARG